MPGARAARDGLSASAYGHAPSDDGEDFSDFTQQYQAEISDNGRLKKGLNRVVEPCRHPEDMFDRPCQKEYRDRDKPDNPERALDIAQNRAILMVLQKKIS